MRYLTNVILSSCAFLLVAVLLREFMPVALEREQEWEESVLGSRAECTVLFVGPSYVKQIVPEHFDDEAQKLETDEHACKLGRTNLGGVELEYELTRLLSQDWPKLKRVVVDISLGDALEFKPQNWFKRRVVDWHTPESMRKLKTYYAQKKPWYKQVSPLWAHLKHYAANRLAVGRGADILGTFTNYQPTRGPSRKRPYEYEPNIKRIKQDTRELERHPKYRPSKWPLALRERIRKHGYEAVFLYAPTWEATKLPDRAVKGKDRLMVLAFGNPFAYPELYTKQARGNTQHISEAAFEAYSRRLAQGISQLKAEQP
jgi:hypothetical protein